MIRTKKLENNKRWLDPLVSDGIQNWLEVGALIKKKHLNVAVRIVWFQQQHDHARLNESILLLSKESYIFSIVDATRLHVGMIITRDMDMMAK